MRTRKQPVILAGVVAVVVIALAAWWITRDDIASDDAGRPASSPSTPESASAPSPSGDEASESAQQVKPEVVKPRPVAKQERGLTDPVELASGAEAVVTRIEAVRSTAEIPGEVSAPALRFTIEATAGARGLDLAPVVVNAYYGRDRTPATAMTSPGSKPFAGQLAPSRSATGVFIFNVPPRERGLVHLEFSWAPGKKPVILTGNVS